MNTPHPFLYLFQMGHMDGLEMLDPISSSSMTTLTPMSETPSHMHSYGTNHFMNHHHHGGPLSGHGAPGNSYLYSLHKTFFSF